MEWVCIAYSKLGGLINFVFGNSEEEILESLKNKNVCILSPKNEETLEFNECILDKILKGIKMTYEPPRGLKNNLLRTFGTINAINFE